MTYTPVCPHCCTGEPFYRSGCQGCMRRKAEAEKVRRHGDRIIETTKKEMCDAQ